jgi:uncharacterized membrane protein YphA (DoxX/SURF4 family)
VSLPTFPDLGLAALHIATGTFFTITGARKLFVPSVHAKVTGLFSKLGVGSKFVEWAVPGGEFLGGLGLLFGVLTQPAALGLLVIMAGAYKLSTWPEVKAKNPRGFDLVAKCLCTAEGQLIVALITLALMGAGSFSGDALLAHWGIL